MGLIAFENASYNTYDEKEPEVEDHNQKSQCQHKCDRVIFYKVVNGF